MNSSVSLTLIMDSSASFQESSQSLLLPLIAWTAYGFSVVSFGLFVVLLLRAAKPKEAPESRGEGEMVRGPQDVAVLTAAAQGLADSFSKAPSHVLAMTASVFFFAIAFVSAWLPAKEETVDKQPPAQETPVGAKTAV